jgi:hypothetical protein
MEKSYYLVTFRPEFSNAPRARPADSDQEPRRLLVSITQGGFGQDVVDDEAQLKQRFLEYLFAVEDIDLPRTAEIFDERFELERIDELIDLDEEL